MLDKSSLAKLKGVHPDLVGVAKLAHEIAIAKGLNFRVTEGLRTIERQRELVKAGASKTLNSRHLTGHAFDFVPVLADNSISWKWPAFWPLVACFESAAGKLAVEIQAGARWVKFPDGPHIELQRKKYP